MTACERLSDYLDRMARRFLLYRWTSGFSTAIGFTLVLTIALAWILTLAVPSPSLVALCRHVLFWSAGIAAACAITIPLWHRTRKSVARKLERKCPRFEQRLITFLDRSQTNAADPFLPLLAENALELSRSAGPETLIARRKLTLTAIAGAACGLVLASLILWTPGQLGNGARALWTGKTVFSIAVKADRRTVRRGGDLVVSAHLTGFNTGKANLWIRDSGAGAWRSNPMLATSESAGFGLQLSSVRESVEYYVEADGIRSPVAHVNVVDLPGVRNIRVSYPHDPSREGTAGDIVAPAGTIANIEIETDRPMTGGQFILEEDNPIALPPTRDNKTSASLRVLRDDGYRVSILYDGEPVPVSDEHAIEVLTRDRNPGQGTSLLTGLHAGPVPAGYEKAVSDYYKRLGELQNSR